MEVNEGHVEGLDGWKNVIYSFVKTQEGRELYIIRGTRVVDDVYFREQGPASNSLTIMKNFQKWINAPLKPEEQSIKDYVTSDAYVDFEKNTVWE